MHHLSCTGHKTYSSIPILVMVTDCETSLYESKTIHSLENINSTYMEFWYNFGECTQINSTDFK
jgi:hypothetical protein